MNRFLRYALGLALGLAACTVPDFKIAPDQVMPDGTCETQTLLGKTCGGACAPCSDGAACELPSDCDSGVCESAICAPAATCEDLKINGMETDTDCGGGTCDKCSVDSRCTRPSDCLSNLCNASICTAPETCTDSKLNGTESDMDCGGSCTPCANGLRCTRASDCASSLCEAGMCKAAPTCDDKQLNGTESDTDCGGSCTSKCALDAHCTRAADCESNVCKVGVCAAPVADPTCADKAKNGTETDTDCGGTCDPCAVNKRCAVGADCVTLVCSTVCQPAGCNDKVRNGNESDVDCGGSCTGCDLNKVCNVHIDCKTGSCSGGHCIANTCTDNLKNGSETGKDCGGGSCGACVANEGCSKASDCQSLVCTASKCAVATCTDGVKNALESETDCGMGCPGCAIGKFCNGNGDCATGRCTSNTCVPTAPTGSVLPPTTWTATASHDEGPDSPKKGIDSNLSTRWGTGTGQASGMWYQVDMQKPQIFFSMTLDTLNDDGPNLFNVYLSQNGTTWTLAKMNVVGTASTKVDFGTAQVARYVKFELTNNKPGSWWTMRELYVAN